jgi:hypothetical protein
MDAGRLAPAPLALAIAISLRAAASRFAKGLDFFSFFAREENFTFLMSETVAGAA